MILKYLFLLASIICVSCSNFNYYYNKKNNFEKFHKKKLVVITNNRYKVDYTIWNKIRKNSYFQYSAKNKYISFYLKKYLTKKSQIKKSSYLSAPYIYYILEKLLERNMPSELSLLPIIESDFQPHAISYAGAMGIWQIMPNTGKYLGLEIDSWYNGFKDFIASTDAILNYFQFLHKKFNGNWHLSIAAYNAGPGFIGKLVRNNKKIGKPHKFWDLELPRQTKHYLPKLLSLSHIINSHKNYGINLYSVKNKPYFLIITMDKYINFYRISKLALIDVAKIQNLNPFLIRRTTHPIIPARVILPLKNANAFLLSEKIFDLRKLLKTTYPKKVK